MEGGYDQEDDEVEVERDDDGGVEGGQVLCKEVSLVDLIRPERKRNGIAHGFELVPRVRTVMIIDDENGAPPPHERDTNEILDWEIIPDPTTKRKRRPLKAKSESKASYAAVVAMTA